MRFATAMAVAAVLWCQIYRERVRSTGAYKNQIDIYTCRQLCEQKTRSSDGTGHTHKKKTKRANEENNSIWFHVSCIRLFSLTAPARRDEFNSNLQSRTSSLFHLSFLSFYWRNFIILEQFLTETKASTPNSLRWKLPRLFQSTEIRLIRSMTVYIS